MYGIRLDNALESVKLFVFSTFKVKYVLKFLLNILLYTQSDPKKYYQW